MASLKELVAPHSMSTDVDTTHSYVDIYEIYFADIREKTINVLLIDVEHNNYLGGFLHACHDYFPNATFYVVDPSSPERFDTFFKQPNIVLYSQAPIHNHDFVVDTLLNQGIRFDLIIEDNSPRALVNMATIVKEYSPLLKPGGMLFIEDLEYPDNTQMLDAALPSYLEGCSQIFDLRDVKGRHDDILYLVTAPATMPTASPLVLSGLKGRVDTVITGPTVQADASATIEATVEATIEATVDADASATIEATVEVDASAIVDATVEAVVEVTGPTGATVEADASATGPTGAIGEATIEATIEATVEQTGPTGATGTNV